MTMQNYSSAHEQCHGMTANDSLLMTDKTPAWHGMGLTIDGTTTPVEGAKKCGLSWTAEQWPLTAVSPHGDGFSLALDHKVANIRSDTRQCLGVVGSEWIPVQPLELAELAESLAIGGDVVKVESIGSIKGGAKFWFLLRGNSFSVRNADELRPYICLSSGFDGLTGTRATFTEVRVQCKNTLAMVIPMHDGRADGGGFKSREAGFSFGHVGKVADRLIECRQAIGLYQKALGDHQGYITALASKEVNTTGRDNFLVEMYAKHFGKIAVNPATEKEVKHREKALDAVAEMVKRFELELSVAGPTAWNALNSYTGWLQHDRHASRKVGDAARDGQAHSRLIGQDNGRTVEAFNAAMSL